VTAVAEPRWSVVIPAYNEALRLPPYLADVVAYFDGRGEPYEVLVVDDGSRDETAARVLEAQAAHPSVSLHRLEVNRGKGFAVRAGMRAARGVLRLMADADGATPIGEVKRLEAAIQAGADIAVGSRALSDPSVSRQVRLHRQLSGELFNFLVRQLGVPGIKDTQCGFKLFRGAAADTLFGELRTDGFGFDVELFLLAGRRGYRVAEVAINWADRPGSKVAVWKDGPRMLAQILAARRRLARSDKEPR
jgi:dolichyl-phosphate beta-glucosyltransferase